MSIEEGYVWLCVRSRKTAETGKVCEDCIGGFNCINTIITKPHRVEALLERKWHRDDPPSMEPYRYVGKKFKPKKSKLRAFDNRVGIERSKGAGSRKAVYDRDGWRCLKCGACKQLTLDHVLPKSKGGSNAFDNLQTLCKPCNEQKGAEYVDYRAHPVPMELLYRKGAYPKTESGE